MIKINNNKWVHTKEEKEKISQSKIGIPRPKSVGEAVSKFRKGKKWEQSYGKSKADRMKILKSESMKGLGNHFFMKRHTPKSILKMSKATSLIWNRKEYNFNILKEGRQIEQLGILLNSWRET